MPRVVLCEQVIEIKSPGHSVSTSLVASEMVICDPPSTPVIIKLIANGGMCMVYEI